MILRRTQSLKRYLPDQLIGGRPSGARQWQECFAQLVGTVLSIWDASELDRHGGNGDVKPTFINISDASIKMIASLPMSETGGRQLSNVLSVSTAGSNRYLLHFTTYASMTQWTAAIRLSMYENITLQEAYTGSLIAGKGKSLNNIRQIMERSPFKYEDWARVRFGTGTPWRKCWFVITPPDEKEYQKLQKALKKNPYEKPPALRGTLKFYENKRVTKKTRPIATISDVFSAYAIYPASKPLIEQSTLLKIDGTITIHEKVDSSTEGSIFVMPEMHAAVSGFEMLLRFLFPLYDTFALYGRPNRLIADVRDTRGLMFAMPKGRSYGYLENLDVSTIVSEQGSDTWTEREWRKKMKDLTSKRMTVVAEGGDFSDTFVSGGVAGSRMSLPPTKNGRLRFEELPSERTTPLKSTSRPGSRQRGERSPPRVVASAMKHKKSASEAHIYNGSGQSSQQYNHQHHGYYEGGAVQGTQQGTEFETSSASSRDSGARTPERVVPPEVQLLVQASPQIAPVAAPPVMSHAPSQKPQANLPLPPGRVNLDHATLNQVADMRTNPGTHQVLSNHSMHQGQQMGGRLSWEQQQGGQTGIAVQNGQPPYQKQYPNRLATIPASPYIDPAMASPGSSGASTSYFQYPPTTIIEHSPAGTPPVVARKPIAGTVNPQSEFQAYPGAVQAPPVPAHAARRPESNTQGFGQTMYGGQLLPEDVALAMKTRDLSIYGPQHVQQMEQMTAPNYGNQYPRHLVQPQDR